MAFNLKNYLTNFQFDSSVEGLKEASDTILKNSNLFDMIGQSSPVAWAGQVQGYLKNIADIDAGRRGRYNSDGEDMRAEFLNDATRWLSGGAQPRAASSFQRRYRESISDVKNQIENKLSNIANVLDFPKDISTQERAALEAKAASMQKELDQWKDIAVAFDIPIPTITRIESGFIPTSEVTQPSTRSLDNATVVAENKGTFEVRDANDPTKVYTTAPTMTEALAKQNQLETGGTPTIAGRPDLLAVAPTVQEQQAGLGNAAVATPEQIKQIESGTLPSLNAVQGVPSAPAETTSQQTQLNAPESTISNATDPNAINPSTGLPNALNDLTKSLTPQDLEDIKATYSGTQNNDTLIDKVMNFQQITDEDMKGFFAKAKAEQDPYYNQIFSRAGQDFEYSLDFMKKQRETQMEEERIRIENDRRAARADLESRGLTFSGEGVRQLGGLGALTAEQIGKILPEGSLPQQERLMLTSNQANFEKNLRDYTRGTEDVLGSQTLAGLKTPTLSGRQLYQAPSERVYGSLERERTTNEQLRAAQLQEEERLRRAETLASQGGVTTV